MADIERAWLASASRRKALVGMGGLIAASPFASAMAQVDPNPLSQHSRTLSLPEMQTAFDFAPIFKGNVILSTYDYTEHAEGSEFTKLRNRQAYEWVDILQGRAPVPVSQVDLSSEMLGVKMKFPIIVAPSSGQGALHPDAESGMFKAATAASNTLMMLSAVSTQPITQVVPASPGGTLWAQHYPQQDLAATQRTLDGYQNAGGKGIIITVDQQASYYERTVQDKNLGGRAAPALAGGGGGARATATGAARYRVSTGRLWYTWQHIEACRKMIKGPMLLKGIMDPEDARLAIEHGADGIIVSNHGGRSMDYGPSTLEVLPEIVAAVNGRIAILFDSGVRRGADVFKALALGANGVMLGRAARWGLGAFGAAGAQRVIEIIQNELVQTAAAAGCARLSDINKQAVRTHFV